MIVKSITSAADEYTVLVPHAGYKLHAGEDKPRLVYMVAFRVWLIQRDPANNKWKCVSNHLSPVGVPYSFENFATAKQALSWLDRQGGYEFLGNDDE